MTGAVGGRLVMDRLLLSTPVLGRLAKKVAVARLCRTVGSLLAPGVSILDGLVAGARTAGNAVMEQAIVRSRDSVAMGQTVSDALASNPILPSLVSRMVSVGEQTGRLDGMLDKVADFYDDEVDAAVSALTSIIEPLMIVLMGGIVGGMLIAMYLPMFKLVSVVSGG